MAVSNQIPIFTRENPLIIEKRMIIPENHMIMSDGMEVAWSGHQRRAGICLSSQMVTQVQRDTIRTGERRNPKNRGRTRPYAPDNLEKEPFRGRKLPNAPGREEI
ncbi:MAG: hypothetical protein MJY79_07585 [Bacteroidaceae bacterium]|nr:hypothetical protein [Bacteroidaceae bacterium]